MRGMARWLGRISAAVRARAVAAEKPSAEGRVPRASSRPPGTVDLDAFVSPLLPVVGAGRYRGGMDGVTTCEQLQAMTPEQRRAHFYASIVLDPSNLRPGMQQRLEEMGAELDERQQVREERLRGQAS